MAATLEELLLAPETRPTVVDDCLTLIEQEVSDKSGASGAGIKLAYKTAKSFAPHYLRNTVNDLLPQIAAKLEPFWAEYNTSGGSAFGDYLAKRGDEVSQALLEVTDGIAEQSKRPIIVKAYRSVRGNAGQHIEAALPRVGDLVLKYAG